MNTLTNCELQVLAWLYYGKGNIEIGQLLGVSPNTIKNHITSIMNKLGVETRTRAVTLALEQGLLTMAPNVTAVLRKAA